MKRENERKNKKQEQQEKTLNLADPDYYMYRELSWFQFNLRVLNEARDRTIPFFERLEFLGIASLNLDEFLMIRMAPLKDQMLADFTKRDIAGLTAVEQLKKTSEGTHEVVKPQYHNLKRSLLSVLEKKGLHLTARHEELGEKEQVSVGRYFRDTICPVLIPIAADSSRPFLLVRNKTLNIATRIRKKEHVEPSIRVEEREKKDGQHPDFTIMQASSALPRPIELPPGIIGRPAGKKTFILFEEITKRNISSLFLNYDTFAAYPFRIMWDVGFELDEKEAVDLLVEVQKKLKRRQWDETIRLEVEEGMDEELPKILQGELEIESEDLFSISGPLDLTVLVKFYDVGGFDCLKLLKHVPQPVPAPVNEKSIFANTHEGDVLLSHPHRSFDPVVNFIQETARDPDVFTIEQALHRMSSNSPIVQALAKAVDNGKQVTVLVESKAHFDEENNIAWAEMLEKVGYHVIYGLLSLKTYSKTTLVVRSEEGGIRHYAHLDAGNYDDSAAEPYMDLGLLTCEREFDEDVITVFNVLPGYPKPLFWSRLIVVPLWIRERLVREIERVRATARAGEPTFIIARVNSLLDSDMARKPYRASMDGVQVDLIAHGVCCPQVGISDISENIHIRSAIGNFLEHARTFRFHANDEEMLYLGSADWMNRDFDNRVKTMFPIMDSAIYQEVRHYLETELHDNAKTSIYRPDGSYEKENRRGRVPLNSQEVFAEEAAAAAAVARLGEKQRGKQGERGFTPLFWAKKERHG